MRFFSEEIAESIRRAIREDLGSGDVTSETIVPQDAGVDAQIVAKQTGIIAGLDMAQAVFLQLDPHFQIRLNIEEGERVASGQKLATMSGSARAVLAGERTALNFLARMSGIATLTRQFVDAVETTKAIILDTRKTAPGLRAIDKLAVRRGGGQNHRAGLYDMILIKDNHIDFAGSLVEAVRRVRAAETDRTTRNDRARLDTRDDQGYARSVIEVEARNLQQLGEALDLGVEWIMLDNMPLDVMREAVRLARGRAKLEASGNVTLENVRQIADTGVDFISVGALTHSAKAFDLTLRLSGRQ